MKRKIKSIGKILEIGLIVLTFISLTINALEYTNIIYNYTYDTTELNNILITTPFTLLLWINNILIFIVSIFYVIYTVQQKKNILFKLSFCLFSFCTTMIVSTFIINGIAELFGIF